MRSRSGRSGRRGEKVKANKGAAGVDGVSHRGVRVRSEEQPVQDLEPDVVGDVLPASGEGGGDTEGAWAAGTRILGVPTVADRVAQTVVAQGAGGEGRADLPPGLLRLPAGARRRWMRWRPAGSGAGRTTGWSIRHPEVLRQRAVGPDRQGGGGTLRPAVGGAVCASGGLQPRWQLPDGTLAERDRGTPQGSAVSPVLANLFLHYAFDAWMARDFPGVPVRALRR